MARRKAGPALEIETHERKDWKGKLDVSVVTMIEAYPAYYAKEKGGAAPTPESVVEAAIKKTIGNDPGFKKYLSEQSESSGAAAGGGASKGSQK